jgi:hypothetical protein
MMEDQQEQPQYGRDADGKLWLRTGNCIRCGECCKSGDPFDGQKGVGRFPGACPLLGLDGNTGQYKCLNRQDPYYLNGCASWPSIPQHIEDYPSCSYVFELVEGEAE